MIVQITIPNKFLSNDLIRSECLPLPVLNEKISYY